jgi:hypothetical protein
MPHRDTQSMDLFKICTSSEAGTAQQRWGYARKGTHNMPHRDTQLAAADGLDQVQDLYRD